MQVETDQMPMPEEQEPEDLTQVISFRLGGETFALDILDVQEIIREQRMTRVPGSSSVNGVIHLRGKVLPVIALRERFGFAAEAPGPRRIVVVQKGSVVAGFLVDSVPEVLRIANRDICPLQHRKTDQCDVVSGAVKAKPDNQRVMLLDTNRLLKVDGSAKPPVTVSSV